MSELVVRFAQDDEEFGGAPLHAQLRADAMFAICDNLSNAQAARTEFTVRAEDRTVTFYGPADCLSEIGGSLSTAVECCVIGKSSDVHWG